MSKKQPKTAAKTCKAVSYPEARKLQIKKAAQRREAAKQQQQMREWLYGFYCAGFAGISAIGLSTPAEVAAFAMGVDAKRRDFALFSLAAFCEAHTANLCPL